MTEAGDDREALARFMHDTFISDRDLGGWLTMADAVLAAGWRRPATREPEGLRAALEALAGEWETLVDWTQDPDSTPTQRARSEAGVVAAQQLRTSLAEHLRSPKLRLLEATDDTTRDGGLSWGDGLDDLDRLLDDCAQDGQDHLHHVRVSAVRDIVNAVRRYEDETDESIRSALWEDAVTNGEPWATGDES